MTTDIPSTLGAVSAEWLDQQLAAAGHDLPAIETLTLEPMDGFVGALGEVGIVRVTWGDAAPDLPSSFVAKCPLDEDMAKIFNEVMQYYVREAGFYRDLVHRVDMTIPKAWVNLYDHDTGAGFLMLDHVTDATKGDILSGCSVEEMRGLVAQLARMHGTFWMDESLRELPWLMDWSAESFELGIPIIGEAWETLTTQEPDRIPTDVADMVGQTWINDTVNWLARFGERPWTLTHIDYELDNVLFTADGPVIIDWQSPMRTFPGLDLGWLLAASHNAETLAAEPELLELYRAELLAAGGPDWSAERLEEDLAVGMLHFLGGSPVPYLQDTAAHGPNADRMHARFEKFLQGCIDASVRWNLVDHVGRQRG